MNVGISKWLDRHGHPLPEYNDTRTREDSGPRDATRRGLPGIVRLGGVASAPLACLLCSAGVSSLVDTVDTVDGSARATLPQSTPRMQPVSPPRAIVGRPFGAARTGMRNRAGGSAWNTCRFLNDSAGVEFEWLGG